MLRGAILSLTAGIFVAWQCPASFRAGQSSEGPEFDTTGHITAAPAAAR